MPINNITEGNNMNTRLLVRHEVSDYAKWKSFFDAHGSVRKNHGIKALQVLRDSANQNDISVIFEVADISKAKAFANSTELKELLKKSGVIGKTEMHFYSDK